MKFRNLPTGSMSPTDRVMAALEFKFCDPAYAFLPQVPDGTWRNSSNGAIAELGEAQ